MNCPICKGESQSVSFKIVSNFVNDIYVQKIINENYYLCLNSHCEVSYFNKYGSLVLRNKDLKTPIGFKDSANPKYICYCNKVTEEQIVKAVVEQGARNIRDIIKITGAMKNSNCKINNPLGVCCSQEIQKVIDQTIKGYSHL